MTPQEKEEQVKITTRLPARFWPKEAAHGARRARLIKLLELGEAAEAEAAPKDCPDCGDRPCDEITCPHHREWMESDEGGEA